MHLFDHFTKNLGDYSLAVLIAAVLVPALLFILLISVGFHIDEIPIVAAVFWILLVASGIFALADVLRSKQYGISRWWRSKTTIILLLVTYVGVGAIFAKLSAHHYRETMPETTVKKTEERLDRKCGIELLGKNQPPKYVEAGIAGRFGWIFSVANLYEWRAEIELSEASGAVRAVATVSGVSSPWYGFSLKPYHLRADATGEVQCRIIGAESFCKAIAIPSKQLDVNHFASSAALVQHPSEGLLESEGAISINGELAINEISIGGKNVVGTKLHIQSLAKRNKTLHAYYYFRCITK